MTTVRALLGSLLHEPRAPDARPVGRRDLVLVATAVAVVAVEAAVRPDLEDRLVQGVVVGVAVLALLWRRAQPVLAVVLAIGPPTLLALATGVEIELFSSAVLLAVPYGLARWGSGRDVVVGTGLFAVQQGAVLTVGADPVDSAGGLVVLSAVLAAGAAMRFRARARARTLEEVRLRERERIARDLHDTVAQHVSVIAVRAQVGQAVAVTEPGRAVGELAVIVAEARRTLEEMRALVRLLRQDGHDAATPDVADLHRLATSAPDAPPVRVDTDDLADVAPPVLAAVVRIAQEAVTNTRRHARDAGAVDVVVRLAPDAVRLRVHDDGAPVGRRGDGWGLAGMRERAALLGGSCDAEPDPDGGWTVTATLPRRWSG